MKFPLNTEIEINMGSVRDIVATKISKEIVKQLYDRSSYGRMSTEATDILKTCISDFLTENRDVIIDETVKKLSQRLANTKALKDKLVIILEDTK